MMSTVLWQLLVLVPALAADLPTAEVETLKSGRHSGPLAAISESSVRLSKGEAPVDVPLSDILEIRVSQITTPDPVVGPRVVLVDGTKLTCREFTIEKGQARLSETSQCGTVTLPVSLVAEVRFGLSTGKLDEAWAALQSRESKTDLLVIKKDEVLDHLGGVTGDVAAKIRFILDGEEVPVSREKVYGILFRRKPPKLPKVLCQVALTSGDVLQAGKIDFDGSQFRVRFAGNFSAQLAADSVSGIDFSAGKIRYLSQLEPREVLSVPFFDPISYREYRRDRSLDGTPLMLAGKSYSRGLAINSRTTLRYRIGGEFSRFQAVMGIDDAVGRQGNVTVVISGDGRQLFSGPVRGDGDDDAPRTQLLDLDVSGVRDLEILVDFGDDNNTGDYLDLADARLVK